MAGLVQTFSEATVSLSSSSLIVSRDSFSRWTWARLKTVHRTVYSNGCSYRFLIYYLYYHICMCCAFLWPLHFSWLLVLSLYKGDYLQILRSASFWLPVNQLKHTSWMDVVIQTVRRCTIVCHRRVWWRFGIVNSGFEFSVCVRDFVI